ncbi:hypothetical protein ACQQ2N_02310 [Dokdonella sp. MW10]|uniref:hypothetical protein n=1 Tax=Dokdonella sp. MW10 TaxID=2992926 RepID=UPI003F81C3B9
MNPPNHDQSLDRVKDEIRAEADAIRQSLPQRRPVTHILPVNSAGSGAAPRGGDVTDRSRRDYTIPELCASQYGHFVETAMRALLKRPGDQAGRDLHVARLIAGASKIEILGDIAYSAEGRAVGVKVAGLRPRYLMAKFWKIPLLGYAAEWVFRMIRLPVFARQLRASETYQSAQTHILTSSHENLQRQVEALAARIDAIAVAQSGLRDEFASRARDATRDTEEVRELVKRGSSESGELRHLVLGVNHWLASLRKNLADVEAEQAEAAREADGFVADVVTRALAGDGGRELRLLAWSSVVAGGVPEGGTVLDLGGGKDWLAVLASRGLRVSGVAESPALEAMARAEGHHVAASDPAIVLARTGDATLHGLTALAIGPVLRRMPMAALLATARRVLRPGGFVLFGFGNEASHLADRLAGHADIGIAPSLLAEALSAAGFTDVQRADTPDGVVAVSATRA